MAGQKETHEFKTEVQQLLNLIVNSLYSNPEIFLRELISNASDAIDKARFRAQQEPEILGDDTDFSIWIAADGIQRTLTVSDNGIGMTRDEVTENIGTIAQSGTAAFLEAVEQARQHESLAPELIGQFGVGFYSAFMVAERVVLETRSPDSPQATRWESSGDGSYSIEEVEKTGRGTTITLHLRKPETDGPDFTDQSSLQRIVKQHSDFVDYPIEMDVEREETIPDEERLKDQDGKPVGESTRRVTKTETLNSMKAIWAKDKNEISDAEYEEFFRHISHDWNPPLSRLHMKFEGTTEYTALLYIPSKAPFDIFSPETRHGIQLYCRRVFIMDDCEELMPDYLRFVKGVVDAPDLNLNVSREILQQDRLVRNIRRNLVKKILAQFEEMDAETYEKFYTEFGPVLKLGIHTDRDNQKKLADLLRYRTTKSGPESIPLRTYVERMQEGQDEIYYITGENLTTLLDSPHLERLKKKDIEVLLMSDPVDEWVVQGLEEYDGKKLKSAEKGDLGLDPVDEKKKEEYNALFGFIRAQLQEKVREVRPSTRLIDSVACLAGEAWDMSAYMEKILKASGQKTPEAKRVLELNMEHPLMERIRTLFETERDDPRLKSYSQLLFDMALIGEGGKIEDPARFAKTIGDMMAETLAG